MDRRLDPFEGHSEEEVKRWIAQLRFFRLVHGHGTHAATPDHLAVRLRYRSPDDLQRLCRGLGVSLEPYDPALRPEPGRGYSHAEFEELQEEIPDAPEWAQPGLVRIAESPAGLFAENGALRIALSCARLEWGVDALDVEHAVQIEARLERLRDAIEDPPEDSPRCICPRYYPELWPDG